MSLKCQSCGNELSQQVKFCPRCGAVVSQVQSPGANVEATEPLLAEQDATVHQRTEALVPDTEELPVISVSTNKISQPATAELKPQKEAAAVPTAIQSKPGSPKKMAAFAGFFLLVAVAAISIYFSTAKSSDTPGAPTPVSTPTPIETQQPITNPSPEEVPTPSSEATEKAPEKDGEGSAKSKPAGKDATPSTPTAAELIKQGMNAGSPAAALAAYKRALQIEPGNMEVHYLMGLAYQQMRQPDQALESYRKCKSGTYAPMAAQHVKKLEKDLSKSKY